MAGRAGRPEENLTERMGASVIGGVQQPPTTLTDTVFVLIGVGALLTVSGFVTETFVQRWVFLVLVIALLLLGIWAYRLRK